LQGGKFISRVLAALAFFSLGGLEPAQAIESVFPIHLGEGIVQGDSYHVSVTDFADKKLAGPYDFTVSQKVYDFGIRARDQDRRETQICIQAHDGSKELAGGTFYFTDGRSLQVVPDNTGRLCTPASLNVDSAETAYLLITTESGSTSASSNLTAAEMLGRGYNSDVGNGVPQSDEEAVRWYQLAADKGSIEAKRNLAGMYGSGRGVAEDQEKAGRLFLEAAEAGDAQAQYAYGRWYASGNAEKQKWLELAAQQGHQEAMGLLESAGSSEDLTQSTWQNFSQNTENGLRCVAFSAAERFSSEGSFGRPKSRINYSV